MATTLTSMLFVIAMLVFCIAILPRDANRGALDRYARLHLEIESSRLRLAAAALAALLLAAAALLPSDAAYRIVAGCGAAGAAWIARRFVWIIALARRQIDAPAIPRAVAVRHSPPVMTSPRASKAQPTRRQGTARDKLGEMCRRLRDRLTQNEPRIERTLERLAYATAFGITAYIVWALSSIGQATLLHVLFRG